MQGEHLEIGKDAERDVADRGDLVVLQVEIFQVGETLELIALQLAYAVALKVQDGHRGKPVEGVVGHSVDVGVVEVEHLQVLPSNEGVAPQLADVVPVQEQLGRIHGQLGRQICEVGAGALGYVLRPRVVVVAVASAGTCHLAVARIIVTAVAKGEAVGLVGAEKVEGACVH